MDFKKKTGENAKNILFQRYAKSFCGVFVSIACVFLVEGCATHPDDVIAFPDVSTATLREGTFVNRDNLRQMMPGLTKVQVMDLLGPPHFHEGVFGVKEWNYIFNMRTGEGKNYITCQYLVRYYDGKVRSTHWSDPSCPRLLDRQLNNNEPSPISKISEDNASNETVESISLSSDALFPFDRSELDSMKKVEAGKLDNFLAYAKATFSSIEKIEVDGYADRVGEAKYNEKLSQARAQKILDYIKRAGLKANNESAVGHGSSDPIVDCPGIVSPEIIDCLAPNRRVNIKVYGKK